VVADTMNGPRLKIREDGVSFLRVCIPMVGELLVQALKDSLLAKNYYDLLVQNLKTFRDARMVTFLTIRTAFLRESYQAGEEEEFRKL